MRTKAEKGELKAVGFVIACALPDCEEWDTIDAPTHERARQAAVNVGWVQVAVNLNGRGAWVCPTHGAELGKAARRLQGEPE